MEPARTARLVLLVALALGLLGDYLVRAPRWGLNVALGLTAVAAAALAVSLRPGPSQDQRRATARWPWIAAAFFAAMWAMRDAPLLLAVDLLAALGLACLPVIGEDASGLRRAGVLDVAAAAVRTVWRTATDGADLVSRTGFGKASSPGASRPVTAIAIGLLLALPAVLVFGALFAAADPLFARMVASLLGIDLGSLLSHVILTAVLAWAGAGYLWAHAAPRPLRPLAVPGVRVGHTEAVTVLSATAFVFALFLAVQAGSLFGGEAFVRNRTGLTYAEYARGGFFQLVVAAGLALPLVYVAPFAAGPEANGRRGAILRTVMAVQVGLTALVLASALWRLGLYMRVFGLSEDRVYGAAVLVWIAATIGVFVPTVLRGRPAGAVFGTIIAAVVVLAALNLADPVALVARYNLSHQARRPVDVAYLARLGPDAVPVLAARLEQVPPQERCALAGSLVRRFGTPIEDWRGWSLARLRAARAATPLEAFARSCGALAPAPVGAGRLRPE